MARTARSPPPPGADPQAGNLVTRALNKLYFHVSKSALMCSIKLGKTHSVIFAIAASWLATSPMAHNLWNASNHTTTMPWISAQPLG